MLLRRLPVWLTVVALTGAAACELNPQPDLPSRGGTSPPNLGSGASNGGHQGPGVAAKVTRAVGAPPIGESPDRTFLTLELRLRRAWALSAMFGDKGASALDLIWRKRY